MKKSLVAVSVIVALGAVWTGMSWYTGKQLESRLDRFIEKANTELKNSAPENGLEWQAKDFKRGIFSSDVRLILTTKGGIEEAGIKPNEEVIFKSTIDHGPFPIANLKTFNLAPKMASIHSELEQNDTLKELFNLTDGKQPFKSDVNVSYSGTISANIEFVPIKHTKTNKNGDQRVLSFTGAKINANTNRDLSTFAFTVKSDELSFSDPAKKETISLKGIDFEGNEKKGNFDFYIGNQNFSIGEFSMSGITNEPSISLKGIKVTLNSSEDKDNLNIKVASSIDGLKIKDIEFGSGKFNLGMEKLDSQSVHKFTQAYNEAAQKALATNRVLPDDAVLNNLHLLINKNPQFSISPLSWKNSKGESSMDFKLSLQNIPEDKSALSLMEPEETIRTLVKELSLNINVPKAMLIESIVQADELDGKDKTAAKIKAEQQVQTVVLLGSKFLTAKNGVIGLNFHYANDKVKLNDKESSLHQFLLDNNLSGSYDDADGIESQHDDKAELPVVE
ncbi:YdgA family protein [Xenorhabdus sp. XENO-10]|uniref:YdgA family protein n=1 Tax=Xenorhabdus yunnanensis TaxID=3025878 RepID=A0ABT5LG33_9GAMM|nr:YdgA family protein [Xenorhabdus yunnanensis]MDC9590067.1 YdgA family protein [Xenorhabdus yunnanensis]